MNLNDVLLPENNAGEPAIVADLDTTGVTIAAYEAMNDVDMAMVKVDLLDRAYGALDNAEAAVAAGVTRGYEGLDEQGPSIALGVVCDILDVSADALAAGYESAGAGDKNKGVMTKIYEGMKKAITAVYEAIKKAVMAVVNFFKGLFKSGKDTASKILGIADGDVEETEISKEDAKIVRGDLKAVQMLGFDKYDVTSILAIIDLQKDIIEGYSKTKLEQAASAVSKISNAVSKISKDKKSVDEMTALLVSAIAPYSEKSKSVNVGKAAKKLIDDTTASELKKVKDSDATCIVSPTLITFNKVKITFITHYKDSKGVAQLNVLTKELPFTGKEDISVKSLSKTDAKKVADELKSVTKLADSVLKNTTSDVEKIKKDIDAVISLAESKLKDGLDSDGQILLREAIKTVEKIAKDVVPVFTNGAVATAASVAKNKLEKYVEFSLAKKDKK